MKLALAIAPEGALSSAFVVYRDKLEKSIPKASSLGYQAIELALLNRDQIEIPRVKNQLKQYDLEVSAVSTGQLFAEGNMWFTSEDKSIRDRAVHEFLRLMEAAGEFRASINIGRLRGFIGEEQTPEQAEQRFLECLNILSRRAEELDVGILIEPVNRYEINYINSCSQGIELLKKLGNSRVKLMPDVFHMNIEDRDIMEVFSKWIDYIGYIHFADSNRHAPGQGHLDFEEIVSVISRAGYDGYIGIEIFPEPDPDTAARQAAEHIMPLIRKYSKEVS